MTVDKYVQDKRHDRDCFSGFLNDNYADSTLLFVFYDKDEQHRFEKERAEINQQERMNFFRDPISDKIQDFYESLKPSDHLYNNARNVIKRIQRLVDNVWPNMNYRVTNFG